MTDGKTVLPLTGVYKYINLFDGNKGPCTSGMGAFSPAPFLNKHIEAIIIKKILTPLLKALDTEGISYKGVFSLEIILNNGNPFVCDINYCLKDIEAETILPRLRTDLTEIIMAAIEEKLFKIVDIEWGEEASVCVVLTSEYYPDICKEKVTVKGIDKIRQIQDVFLFHNNTSFINGDIVNTDGVVMSLTALGRDLKDARTKAYDALKKIHFEGMHYRRDIGI